MKILTGNYSTVERLPYNCMSIRKLNITISLCLKLGIHEVYYIHEHLPPIHYPNSETVKQMVNYRTLSAIILAKFKDHMIIIQSY